MKDLFIPVPEILSYTNDDSFVKGKLESYSIGLNNLVSIGTHLFDWEFRQEDNTEILREDEVVQVSIYFKRILELTDSISIQLKEGSIDPAFVQLRVLFEICIQFQHLIESNVLQKSLCILICDMYRKIEMVENPNSLMSTTIGREEVDHSLNVVNSPSLAHIKTEYESIRTVQNKGEIKWYRLFSSGTPNFGRLIESHYANYKLFYGYLYKEFGNDVVHSTSLLQGNFKYENGTISIPSMRNSEGALDLASWTFHLVRDTFEKFILRRTQQQRSLYVGALMRCEKEHFEIAFALKKYLDYRIRNGNQR